MHAQQTVSTSRRPSVSAAGAAGSFLAAATRKGWKAPAFNAVLTADGTLLELDKVAPKTVMKFMVDDYNIAAAQATQLFHRLYEGTEPQPGGYAGWDSPADATAPYWRQHGSSIPWLEPAAAVLGSRWAKSQPGSAVASVAALVEGGWWPQERLYRMNLAAGSIVPSLWCARGHLVASVC